MNDILIHAESHSRKENKDILVNINNVECSMNDILIHAESLAKLHAITKTVIETLNKAGLKLSKEKCIFAQKQLKFLGYLVKNFNQKQLKFLGYLVTADGLMPDPEKDAIKRLKTSTNEKKIQRILEPLRKLSHKDTVSDWNIEQDQALTKLKEALTAFPVLGYYDVNYEVLLSVDSSSKAVGAAKGYMT
ncbi:Reverse transcriptase (RNA-dependent DNA polymerase) [Popillia japonica]|uniref:Reverse transcriptase (RNA-dependent DNA polymerase) n=1 Tax=Popillia japonica TaxID=7064 RepID=A0AAW1L4R7_POPJA